MAGARELRVACRELDEAFARPSEPAIRDALFQLVPKVRLVLEVLARTLAPGAAPLAWQPDVRRRGSNGPTEEWELSCRADASPGVAAATISALVAFHNPYTGGGSKLEAHIYPDAGTRGHFFLEAFPAEGTRASFHVRFPTPLTSDMVTRAFAGAFDDAVVI